MVRLHDHTGEFIGTAEVRVPTFRQRTIRHEGIVYELMREDAAGVRHYRAMSRALPAPPRIPVLVMDTAGNIVTTLFVSPPIPGAVTVHDRVCPLWTIKDQGGYPRYL